MSDLLDTVIEAHGGLERWCQLAPSRRALTRAEPCGPSRASRACLMTSSSGQACTRSANHIIRSAPRPSQRVHAGARGDRDHQW